MKKLLLPAFLLFTLSLFVASCAKTEFDEPPTTGTPVNIPAADIVDIADLKALHEFGSIETLSEIESLRGKYITGVITADDESGNFYKNFVMQDATAAITVRVAFTDSYPFYSEGREVFVKLDELFMGDFRGVTQLGGFLNSSGELEDIVNTDEIILPGERGNPVQPALKSIDNLTRDDVSKLIKLQNVEFANGAFQLTYADGENLNTENRDVKNCDGDVIVVRTSGFADFAGDEIPDGNGTIVGIYSIFESGSNVTQQLLIRSPEDVDMEGPRCDGGGGGGGGGNTGEPITELFEDFNSGSDNDIISLAGWSNLSLQGTRQWQIGQFNGASAAEITAFGAGGDVETWLITPQIDLSGERYLSFETAFAFYAHQGLEVLISTNYEGGNPNDADWMNLDEATIADGDEQDWNEYVPSGDIDIATFGDLGHVAFKYTGTDPGSTTNWLVDNICISAEPCSGNGGGGGGGGGGNDDLITELFEDFDSFNDNDLIDLEGWDNVATEGSRQWQIGQFDGVSAAEFTAFSSGETNVGWLITPAIDLSGERYISFETAFAFYAHQGLEVLISTDYDGENVNDATWQDLGATIADGAAQDWNEYVPSGDLEISSYGEVGYVAFKYTGADPGNTTNWLVDNICISATPCN